VAQFEFHETGFSGCYLVQPIKRPDERGHFVKTFVQSVFDKHNLETAFVEQYVSQSQQGVIRGLHFQRPPHDHAKLVYCLSGSVLDVVVDLRPNSTNYKRHLHLTLSAENATMLYIPRGFAHGFESLQPNTLMMYHVSSEYAPSHDDGILWSSIDTPWQSRQPIVSDRDQNFVSLTEFVSPFGMIP
jgi:dTDP-4-dehydrorhamnose 3,5-epimerase